MNPEIHADYYALCDQDDIWDCNKLEYAINALREQKIFHYGVLIAGLLIVREIQLERK